MAHEILTIRAIRVTSDVVFGSVTLSPRLLLPAIDNIFITVYAKPTVLRVEAGRATSLTRY